MPAMPAARNAWLAAVLLLAGAVGLQAGCRSPVENKTQSEAAGPEWTSTPWVETVRVQDGQVQVAGRGVAESARVVLRGENGEVFAASADSEGRFDIHIPGFNGDRLFMLGARRGGEIASGAASLWIGDGGGGASALLAPGQASRRLDARPLLGAIDSDGSLMILSGYATPGEAVSVRLGAEESGVTAGRNGFWTLTAPARGAVRVTVNGAAYDYPGYLGREGGGVDWKAPDGAVLNLWIPPVTGVTPR